MLKVTMIAAIALAGFSNALQSHPDGLAADVCHNDKKNGGCHNHRGDGGGALPVQRASSGNIIFRIAQRLGRQGQHPCVQASRAMLDIWIGMGMASGANNF